MKKYLDGLTGQGLLFGHEGGNGTVRWGKELKESNHLKESRDSLPFTVEFPRPGNTFPGSVGAVDLNFQRAGINLSASFAHPAFLMPLLRGPSSCMGAANLTEPDIPSAGGSFEFYFFFLHVFLFSSLKSCSSSQSPVPTPGPLGTL